MVDMIRDDEVYRPKEVAETPRVSQATISRLIREGKLRAFRVGGQWRILDSEVRRYLEVSTSAALIKSSDARSLT